MAAEWIAWREGINCTGEAVLSFRAQSGRIRAMAVSPEGKFIAAGGDNTTIALWDVAKVLKVAGR